MNAVKIGEVAQVFNGKTPSKLEQRDAGHPVLKIKDVTDDGQFKGRFESFIEKGLAQKLVGKFASSGDTLILNAAHNADYVGSKKFLANHEVAGALVTGEWLVVRPDINKLNAKFAHYWLLGTEAHAVIRDLVKGIHLYPKDVARIRIPLPPLNEQRRITTILDKADALRRKRKRSLDLLDSLTESIFLEMFGFAKVTMKPIGYVCSVTSGSTPSREVSANFGGSIPWVKTTEVKGAVIERTEEHVTEAGLRAARLKLYPKGTVLVAMYGQGATRGKVGILGISATTNQACAAITPGPELNSTFLFHQLKQNYEALRALGRGGNQPNLNGELVKSFEILVPPLESQLRFVEIVTSASDRAKRMMQSSIAADKLMSSLQSRAFSGQL